MRDLILVTGAPRSGVQIVAGALAACGVWSGETFDRRERDGDVMENGEVARTLLSPFLRGVGVDEKGQRFPEIKACKRIAPHVSASWRRRFLDIVEKEGYTGGPMLYASARAALVWPVWRAAFPDARWIVVRRRDHDMIRACLNTTYMTVEKDADGWRRWLGQYSRRLSDVGAEVDLWPDRMIGGDLSECHAAFTDMGLEWDQRAVSDYMQPIQWKAGVFEPATANRSV